MKDELDALLCRKYPGLFRCRNENVENSLMRRGFECGDGWYTIIDVVSELLVKNNPETFAVQVKQKLGSLSFYHSDSTKYSRGVEMMANSLSKYICETCGVPGRLNSDVYGFWATLCQLHATKKLATDNRDVDVSEVAELGIGLAWSRLVVILKKSADWHTEKNRMAEVWFDVFKLDGRLVIEYEGGDERLRGMVDLIVGYAKRIDEDSGVVVGI